MTAYVELQLDAHGESNGAFACLLEKPLVNVTLLAAKPAQNRPRYVTQPGALRVRVNENFPLSKLIPRERYAAKFTYS